MSMRYLACGLSAVLIAGPALAAPKLGGLLGDHAVVQRDQPVTVSGTAIPGETVTVIGGGRSARAVADRTGAFEAVLPALPVGGPYELLVTAPSGTTVVHDLLVGDVVLCSGQSNMEMAVDRAQDSYGQIQSATDDQLRLVTVAKATSFTPEARFAPMPGWASAGPTSAAGFSAACFYMAQELRKSAKVPVGAVHSSWGGSQISAWMGDAAQRAAGRGRQADLIKLYARDPAAASRQASADWERWWREQTGDAPGREPWQPDAVLAWQPVPRIAFYEDWDVPALKTFLGMLWYQKEVTLTPAQAGQQATIAIGAVDDADRTWINGKPIGATGNWSPRIYSVPAGTLVAGRNVITINVENNYSTGGMPGPAEMMKLTLADGSVVPLGEGWRYAIPKQPAGKTPRVPWDDINGAGTLYNAMIAPLGATRFAAVAWYQGESDTGLPGYDDRLKAMMAEWRKQFGQPTLPFAIASLANYGKPATAPGDSGWATVRDAQRRVAEGDGHAGVAITIDLGDPIDIHPGEKHEVGRRLARVVQALSGKGAAPSGPRFASATRGANSEVTVRFADVTGALHARSAAQAIGFELCGAAAGSCRYATARPEGDHVVLASDGQPATRVRYAWADAPVVNLFDEAPLPVGPFEAPLP